MKRLKELEKLMMEFKDKVDTMFSDLYVKDYLVEIGEASGKEFILRQNATCFNSVDSDFYSYTTKRYTSAENYINHKPLIDKWEKEFKQFKINN
jgi:hypothetical protein